MPVQRGDIVMVHYTGKLDSGEVFDSSRERDPLEFEVGAGMVIPGFDDAVMGLEKGQSKTVRIAPEQAYGTRRDDLVIKLERAMFGDTELAAGQHINLQDDRGQVHHADVVEVAEDSVTVDLNHHLAGEALTFDIEVVEVKGA